MGGVSGITFSPRIALACCEPETPVTDTWVLPGVAFEAAEKTNEPLFPTVNVRVDGETVTPEGNPVAETVIDPEKPFSETACTCTFCVALWDKPTWAGLSDNVKVVCWFSLKWRSDVLR